MHQGGPLLITWVLRVKDETVVIVMSPASNTSKPRKVQVQGGRLRENRMASGFFRPGDLLALTIVSSYPHHTEMCVHCMCDRHAAQSKASMLGRCLSTFSSTFSFQASLEFKQTSSFMAHALNAKESWYWWQCQHVIWLCCCASL